MKKKFCLTIIFSVTAICSRAQYNCNVFKLENNQKCYEACVLATEAEKSQGTRESQEQFDAAILLCPTFAYVYFEKSVPYIKRGDLKTWKILIDKAVALDSLYLGYRGWCRFQFARDYRGALADFRALRKYSGDQIGFSQNGDYDLRVVEALCYDQLGETETAIQILEKFVGDEPAPGSYSLLHLGVMKINEDNFIEAVSVLEKAISENPYLADNYFYLARALKESNRHAEFKTAIEKALSLYDQGYFRKDAYTNTVHRVYRSQIERMREGI